VARVGFEAVGVLLIFAGVSWAKVRVFARGHQDRAVPIRLLPPRLLPRRLLPCRLLPRADLPRPQGRPLELIASDARRLGSRFANPPRGAAFAKLEGLRRAYDHVLGEACSALGVDHLLGVLPPGDELDAERARVEGLLWLAGLRIDETA
jgi:hypothetical protein